MKHRSHVPRNVNAESRPECLGPMYAGRNNAGSETASWLFVSLSPLFVATTSAAKRLCFFDPPSVTKRANAPQTRAYLDLCRPHRNCKYFHPLL